jgi:hypothetical protein
MLKCREIVEAGIPEGLNLWKRWRLHAHIKMCKYCPRFMQHLEIARAVAAGVGKTRREQSQEVDRVVEHVYNRLDQRTE